MNAETDQNLQDSQCRIVLVHGTWPAGLWRRRLKRARSNVLDGWGTNPDALWFESSSHFRITLNAHLKMFPHSYYPFQWNGHNSVFARDHAAKDLAALLRECLAAFPNDTLVVIAHSHGGNVVLRALDYLGTNSRRVHIVTMGTPFLRIFLDKTVEGRFVMGAKGIEGAMAIATILSAGGFLGAVAGYDPAHPPTAITLIVLAMVLSSLSTLVAKLLSFFLLNPVESPLPWSRRAMKIAWASYYELTRTPPAHMLVLRTFEDEASLALAAGAVAGHTSRILASRGFVAVSSIFGVALAVQLVPVANAWLSPTTWPKDLTFYVAASFGLLLLLLYALPGLCKGVFGRELLIGALRCEVSAESVPDYSASELVVKTLNPESSLILSGNWPGLGRNVRVRHAIHEHDDSFVAIARWIEQFMRPRWFGTPEDIDDKQLVGLHWQIKSQDNSDVS